MRRVNVGTRLPGRGGRSGRLPFAGARKGTEDDVRGNGRTRRNHPSPPTVPQLKRYTRAIVKKQRGKIFQTIQKLN
eukprot:3747865-Amphidinium_carterae.1